MYKVFFVFLLTIFLSLPTLAPFSPSARASAAEVQNYEPMQGYLEAAPSGLDVRYVWTLAGGHGENVRIIDIESDWNFTHSDLLAATLNALVLIKSTEPQAQASKDHGAAVIGTLIAAADGKGITGIAYGAQLGMFSPFGANNAPRIAEAINTAVRRLQPGDILLIEQQSPFGPRFDPNTGRGWAPVEVEPDVYEAIKNATDKGIVVIEPVGNGFDNLDDPAYRNRFNRNSFDSGAIMVGAGFPPQAYFRQGTDLAPTEESNYGSRVDVQGWGRAITTCGFGDLLRNQGEDNFYTNSFGATSGAAAMVAGAAAVIQSIVKERGLAPLTSMQMRQLLAATGTPQTATLNKPIGSRPNLRAVITALEANGETPTITSVKYKAGAGKLFVDGENFIAGDSIIEINATRAPKVKYPAEFVLPNGITTRLMSKGNISALLPPGVDVQITVFTPSKNRRSLPFVFRYN